MKQKIPNSSNKILTQKRTQTLSAYPCDVALFEYDNIDGQTFDTIGAYGRNFVDDIAFLINNELYEGIEPTTVDLTASGIDGIVDGLSIENGRDYLIWAFANNANTEYLGIGVTRKPYSTFTSTGTKNKGSSATYTLPGTSGNRGYQFTIGARVVVRNQNGSSPQYEWNWGTVTSMTNTTLVVTMDNNTDYGSSITATATDGEILQWDKFRPWVVSTDGQGGYSNNYKLLGDLHTKTSSGDIIQCFKSDECFRPFPTLRDQFVNASPGTTYYPYSMGRDVPLWANRVFADITVRDTASGQFSALYETGSTTVTYLSVRTQVSNLFIDAAAVIPVSKHASLTIRANSATTNFLRSVAYGYYVTSGMRL